MTATLATALLLQLAAVALLRHRLGRTWLRRPVTLLVLASVVYDGVSPLLMTAPSIRQWDNYRTGVQPQYADQAALIMSAGMLALTVAYLLARPERAMAEPGDLRLAARMLDWRLLALACAPLAALTYQGRGTGGARQLEKSLPENLAVSFFIVLVVMAAFALVLRHGRRWFLPALAVQSVLLAAAGERTPVVTGAVTLIVLLVSSGLRPPAGQLRIAAALTAVLMLAVTGTRVQEGRAFYRQDTGLAARLSALRGGIPALAGAGGREGIVAQAAVRLDGTGFAGAVLQAQALGAPRLPPAEVAQSLGEVVPSALWPSKLGRGLALNPTVMETDDDGLQQVNFLPTLTGLYLGFLPWPWLVILLAALGFLAGRGEIWLLRRFTPARAVVLASAVLAALTFEQGLPGMLVALRAGLALAVAVKGAGVLMARRPVPDRAAWRTSLPGADDRGG
jgi:hypothetical protein